MKNAILMLAFFLAAGMATVNAQSCHAAAAGGKSCCMAKASTAAAADPTIEKRQADNGAVTYVRKEADQQGNVRFVSVQYDEAKNSFVNVAPPATAEAAAMAAPATENKMPACCAGKKSCAKSAKACSAAKVDQ